MKRWFILLAILYSIGGIGQNKHPDSLWFLKSGLPDLTRDLERGYNAFFIEKPSEFKSKLDSLNSILTSGQQALFITDFELKDTHTTFSDSLKVSRNLLKNTDGIRFFGIEKNRFNYISYKPDSLQDLRLSREFNLVEVDSLKSKKGIDLFLENLLYKKGVIPDLIVSPFIIDIPYLKKKYYQKPVYRAKIILGNKELNEIGWKEFPHLETGGFFRTSDSTLSPQKRGYMFSPDIYNFTDKNTKISGPKLFRAIKYELDEKLRYFLPLDGKIANLVNDKDRCTSTSIEFKENIINGKSVGVFNGTSSYIDIRSRPEERLEEISISAWIKPNEIDGSFSLIGKGEAFSAKIYYGRLRFTTTGIKDHTTSNRVIEKGEWSHVAFVYVPKQKLYLYVNGDLVEEIIASDIRQTEHALLIGTNLWGQYYSGLMSDVKIWDRALSDDEIETIFLTTSDKDSKNLFRVNWYYIAAFIIFLLISIYIIYRKRIFNQQEFRAPLEITKHPLKEESIRVNSINLLNEFKVWNKNGEDITSKLPPKRRELLLLILLFTLRNGGITSKKLSDILWPGFPSENKKNNRSTQVKELRKTLGKQLDAKILFENKKWQFQFSETGKGDVFILNNVLPDFWDPENKIHSDVQAVQFARIVSKGPLLPQIEVEWLDTIKAEYNSRVLDLLTPFLESEALDNSRIIEIIEAILVVDPLFEPAVRKKVSCFLQQEKYGSAKKTVENYKKLYESYYDEGIDPEFMKLVK